MRRRRKRCETMGWSNEVKRFLSNNKTMEKS